jgi:hypothetical protein
MIAARIIHRFARRKAMNPARSLIIAFLAVALFTLPPGGEKPPKPPPPYYQTQVDAHYARVTVLKEQVAAILAKMTSSPRCRLGDRIPAG